MPCRSEYLEATARERESHEVAKHLVYLFEQTGDLHLLEDNILEAADSVYGNTHMVDMWTEKLCSILERLPEEVLDKYVYNGRDRRARRLADWWENHQWFDDKRVEKARKKEADFIARYKGLMGNDLVEIDLRNEQVTVTLDWFLERHGHTSYPDFIDDLD